MRADWSAQLADHRGAGGKKEAPRANSTVARLLHVSAPDVFELLTFAERRMASTRWDPRESAPVRPVPAGPQR
jgi:hypothetical protein